MCAAVARRQLAERLARHVPGFNQGDAAVIGKAVGAASNQAISIGREMFILVPLQEVNGKAIQRVVRHRVVHKGLS